MASGHGKMFRDEPDARSAGDLSCSKKIKPRYGKMNGIQMFSLEGKTALVTERLMGSDLRSQRHLPRPEPNCV